MREEDGKKRIAIIIVASLFLVAMVIGVTIGISKSEKGSGNYGDISASRKAVDIICQPTDYKDICKSTLEKGAPNTDNPRDLAKAAFNAAVEEINNVTEHSLLLKELLSDPKTANATKVCKELFGYAVEDFRRSMEEIQEFDISNMDEILTNLKVWLSATITYEETCIDGFDKNNTTEEGLKVRKMLTTLMRMSSNGLAIVTGMQQVEQGEDPNSSGEDNKKVGGSKQRRLMSWSDDFVMGHDEFVDDDLLEEIARNTQKKRMRRRLLNDDVVPRWLDADDRRRKLLEDKTLNDLTPNLIVALDGSGNYTKIADAIAEAPWKSKETFVIFIKEGVYNEQLFIEGKQKNVVLIGAGPTKTIITGKLSTDDGTPTFKTCTVATRGDNFMAKDIRFENTAGPEKHQAVAIRVQADKSIFHNCHFVGYQDTLYAHTYRQYYRDCEISGTVDFVFGNAATFFQNCTFVMRKPMENQQCILLAQGRKERRQPTGIVLHKSKIIAAPDYFPVRFQMKAYLGRPWKEYSKSIIMESFIDDLIQPDGWMPWNTTDFGLNTSYFAEYRNEGPGSNTDRRVKWGGVKTIFPSRAESFMPPMFYEGDDWIKASGVPYIPALTTDSSSFTAPPGVVDQDPDNEPSPSDVGDYDNSSDKEDSDSKEKYKSSKDSKSKKSKHKSSEDSGDSSDDSSKDSSDDSSKDSSNEASKESESPGYSEAPASSPESLFYQTPGVDSISEAPTSWGLGVPSESPSPLTNQDEDSNEPSSIEGSSIESMPPSDDLSPNSISPDTQISEAPGQNFGVPSESPSPMADLETTPTQINQDETSDGSLSESPTSTINNERTMIQVSMDEVGEIPSSSPDEGPMAMILDEPPTSESPLSVINLEETLIQEEAPTNAPMGESPSSYVNLERMLMQEESLATLESESPSPINNLEKETTKGEPPISVSPSSFVNLERMLMQEETSTFLESEIPSIFSPESASMQEEPPMSQEEASTHTTSGRMLAQEEPSTTLESESPSSIFNPKIAPMQEEPPISQEEASTTITSECPSSIVNLERMLMQEETPTSTPIESPSSSMVDEEPSMMFNLNWTLKQEESPTSAPSESPSSMDNLERTLIQDVNLERILMEDESPTTTPNESPYSTEEEPPTSTPSESPTWMVNLILMEDESPTSAPSESPSSSMGNLEQNKEEPPTSTPSESPSSAPSESPSSLVNLEKKLLETNEDNGFDDASDDNDDHDNLVTSNAVKMDKVLETLHLKTREDLSLDEVMAQIEIQAPETSPHLNQSPRSIAMAPEKPIKKLRRVLLAVGNDNRDAQLAQLASSPQSKAFMGKNGGSMSASPEAGEFIQQLGLDSTSLPNTPPAKKSDQSSGFKIQFRFSLIVVLMIVLIV